jgi:hypothetical protein
MAEHLQRAEPDLLRTMDVAIPKLREGFHFLDWLLERRRDV